MPRTALTVTEITRSGVAQPAVQSYDNANANSLPWNDGRVFLELSATTGTVNFTFAIPGPVDGQTVPAKSIAAGTTPVLAGPFPPAVYNQADGTVFIDCDSANGRIRVYHA